MKNLPTGLSSFSEVRSRDVVYVDKTELIYKVITEGKYYFLARPRRFGKSLTISTIAEIFSGSKDLFKGLWIEDKWDWNKVHPIVHFSLNGLDYQTLGLETVLINEVNKIAGQHGLILAPSSAASMFRELLEALAAKKGKVVVLIDEYDKPLTDFLEKETLHRALENRLILRGFYGVIKNSDPFLEFFFMTGVSKFSQVNLFSQLNNLTDISLSPRFATLTGYTQEEFEHYFKEWIDFTLEQKPGVTRRELLDEIKLWYDGYSFDAEKHVYNPFSILLFLLDGRFQDYWFKTGTPFFLINLLKERQYFVLNDLVLPPAIFESFDLENLEPRALLFQTGYLTLKFVDFRNNRIVMGYPNQEVERSLHNHLIGALLNRFPVDSPAPVESIRDAFQQNNPARVVEVINSLLTDVPYNLFRGKMEAFYHALVHLHFRYLGLYMDSEVNTSNGRMDAVVQTPTHVYILEFKINSDGGTALQQIVEKGYADKYRAGGKTLVGMGISFDTRRKRVGDWKVASI